MINLRGCHVMGFEQVTLESTIRRTADCSVAPGGRIPLLVAWYIGRKITVPDFPSH